jgi:hypothetical protein
MRSSKRARAKTTNTACPASELGKLKVASAAPWLEVSPEKSGIFSLWRLPCCDEGRLPKNGLSYLCVKKPTNYTDKAGKCHGI